MSKHETSERDAREVSRLQSRPRNHRNIACHHRKVPELLRRERSERPVRPKRRTGSRDQGLERVETETVEVEINENSDDSQNE